MHPGWIVAGIAAILIVIVVLFLHFAARFEDWEEFELKEVDERYDSFPHE